MFILLDAKKPFDKIEYLFVIWKKKKNPAQYVYMYVHINLHTRYLVDFGIQIFLNL